MKGAIMKKLTHVLLTLVALGAAGIAQAQTSPPASADQKSKDPFVERRNEKQEAKKEYKSGKISKEEYKADKAESTAKLKSTGERGLAEQNLDVPPPRSTSPKK
jgi:hypothetical protein